MVDQIRISTTGVPPSSLLNALSQAFSYPWDGLNKTTVALRACLSDAEEPLPNRPQVEATLKASEGFDSVTDEQLAYTRLFIGSFKMEAPPYASFYSEEAHTLNGQAAAEVEAVYAQFGLELDSKEIAPADHLRYLLAFLALMARRFEETGEQAFAEAYGDFRDEYVLSWIYEFQQLVERYAENPYYPELVALIVDTLRYDGAAKAPKGE